jgi:hypothetical protein
MVSPAKYYQINERPRLTSFAPSRQGLTRKNHADITQQPDNVSSAQGSHPANQEFRITALLLQPTTSLRRRRSSFAPARSSR